MNINIIAVGKVKEKYFQAGIDEYLKRLSRFADVRITEIKEESIPDKASEAEIAAALKKEGEKILRAAGGYKISLCVEGKKLTSEGLSAKIGETAMKSGEISFIIGSSHGLDSAVKEKSDFLLSVSDMTFPHTLARLILTEQLYRAFMISSGGKYHK